MVLAALSSTAAWIVIGSYLGLCLLIYLVKRKDVQGRTRATGCLVFLVMFFGLFLIAFASWASDHIF